jgi:hypothetical protein
MAASLRAALLLCAISAGVCLGAEVQMIEALDSDPAASSGGGSGGGGSTQVTLPALEAEITRAKEAEEKIVADLSAEVKGRQDEDQALLKKTEDNKKLLDAEVTARDKLASDNVAAVKAVSDAAQKNTADRSTEKTGIEAKVKSATDTIAAEKAGLEAADSKLKSDLETKLGADKQALQEFETKTNEANAERTRETAQNDQKMASSINAVNDGLKTEQRDRAALINKQDEMINALNNKVQQLAATVSKLQGSAEPQQSQANTASQP